MPVLVGLLCGLVFGVGLVVSGLSDPAKVLNFLDLFGTWDPSLLFVMAAAVAVTAIGFALIRRQRSAPVFGTMFDLEPRHALDARLLAGAAIFGLGWGLSGFCPGPAFTAVTSGATGALAFIPAMLVGLWLGRAPSRTVASE